MLTFMLAAPMFATEFPVHLVSNTLDVYVGYASEKSSDVPGDTSASNTLVVSVKTSDGTAQAIMVWISVRLDDQTRIARHGVLQCKGNGDRIVFRFPLGERRPIELVAIDVHNLRKDFDSELVKSY